MAYNKNAEKGPMVTTLRSQTDYHSNVPQSNQLKPLDTFGKQYCPRPTLCVSQLIYKITNL